MILTCGYCGSQFEKGAGKCESCGAPASLAGAVVPDYRSCPYCHRKLLALASPSCNYCGHRLPDDYIKAREADLKRLAEIDESSREVDEKVDEMTRLKARRKRRKRSSVLDGLDGIDGGFITDLFNLFN